MQADLTNKEIKRLVQSTNNWEMTDEERKAFEAGAADRAERIQNIEAAAETMLETIVKNCPSCPDRTHAMRVVRDAKMWAVEAATKGGRIGG